MSVIACVLSWSPDSNTLHIWTPQEGGLPGWLFLITADAPGATSNTAVTAPCAAALRRKWEAGTDEEMEEGVRPRIGYEMLVLIWTVKLIAHLYITG
ncbi:unnamed protein product [Fusarium venenatum]|uniref:Uncharacterized protein n=1 Tax=Fusarium venenatum TaxID=56646 RepID=A0A2L2TVL2_9HYPO|nr:uncharacterized protein FVRRES_10848 [Fusarium venenatum]CEI70771.1 unnamed protein product [Fusarium venenatum]